MEESSTNKQLAAAASLLTEDLVVEILSRVPYSSLCCFKCVSRSWFALCSDPDLRKKSPQALAGFFYRSLDFKRPLFEPCHYFQHFTNVSGRGRPMVDPSLSFLPSCKSVKFVDCCNGLLLCRCRKMSSQNIYESYYVVCNPVTEKWTVLPDTEAVHELHTVRLGFDPAVSSHFRVFLLMQNLQDRDLQVTGVEIYSSETGGWTYRQSEWGDNSDVHDATKSVFFNGIMHFTTSGSCVVTVDLKGKTWRKIPTPHQTNSSFIGLSQGHLYLVHIDYNDPQLSILVLEDYGSEQWILKHTVSTLELFERRHLKFEWYNEVVAVHPERNLIFFKVGLLRNLISYNMDNRTVHTICTLGNYCVHPYLPYIPCLSEWLSDGH